MASGFGRGDAAGPPVLVVEDNEETAGSLRALLALRGHRVARAEDGQEALTYLRDGHRPAVIILDLRMPVMDGWTFFRELRADPALEQIPVIAFSANVTGDFPGAVATIRKGMFDPEQLLSAVDRAVSARALPH